MKKTLAMLGACVSLLPALAQSATVAELERRLEQLERQSSSRTSVSDVDLKVGGFINAGAAATNNLTDNVVSGAGPTEELSPPTYAGLDEEVTYDRLTSAGIQVQANVSDRVSGTIQLYADGADDFDAQTEWAYITYQFTDATEARAGRLVIPLYMHSQYQNVGYALPWIELPREAYDIAPVRSMEGVDLTTRFQTGNMAHAVNVFHGTLDIDVGINGTNATFRMRDITGINLTSSLGNLSTWLSYVGAEANVDILPGKSAYDIDNDYGYFSSAGFQYDNGALLFMAEQTQLSIANRWFPANTGSYATLGYRFGRFMPHVTWAEVDDDGYNDVRNDPVGRFLYNGLASHQKSWTVGVRADVATNLALKAEVSRFYDLGDDAQSAAAIPPNPLLPGGLPAHQTGSLFNSVPDRDDTPLVFRLAAQMVF
ncbi:MAG: hypothetical protein P1U64_05060 [Alcanivoracaceae bacterium]|nr:hypothetical protein [Alcanivoracaceae bacterium]